VIDADWLTVAAAPVFCQLYVWAPEKFWMSVIWY
jgi:hypothetical protein